MIRIKLLSTMAKKSVTDWRGVSQLQPSISPTAVTNQSCAKVPCSSGLSLQCPGAYASVHSHLLDLNAE